MHKLCLIMLRVSRNVMQQQMLRKACYVIVTYIKVFLFFFIGTFFNLFFYWSFLYATM